MIDRKILNIQALRAFAVLLVVFSHLVHIEGKYGHNEHFLSEYFLYGVSGVDLKVYAGHLRKNELKQMADALGAERHLLCRLLPGHVQHSGLGAGHGRRHLADARPTGDLVPGGGPENGVEGLVRLGPAARGPQALGHRQAAAFTVRGSLPLEGAAPEDEQRLLLVQRLRGQGDGIFVFESNIERGVRFDVENGVVKQLVILVGGQEVPVPRKP